MSTADVLRFAHDSPIGVAVRDVAWLFPALETLHFIGLCFLIGAILVIDLRILGLAREIPIAAALKLIPVALVALALNFVSGVGFFCSNPGNYADNPVFALKMGLVLLGGANALWFEFVERSRLLRLPVSATPPVRTKIVAGVSLATWLAVLISGRLLPYVAMSTN